MKFVTWQLKDCHQILCEEANKILAFLAADSE